MKQRGGFAVGWGGEPITVAFLPGSVSDSS
jgi:hypothetical protein